MGKTLEQQQARGEFTDIEIQDAPAKAVAVGRDNDELAGIECQCCAVAPRDEALAFQHHDFKTAVGENGANNGGAEHGRRRAAVFDGAAALARR